MQDDGRPEYGSGSKTKEEVDAMMADLRYTQLDLERDQARRAAAQAKRDRRLRHQRELIKGNG